MFLEVEIKVDADDGLNIDIDAHRIGHLIEDMLRFGEGTALVYVHDAKGKKDELHPIYLTLDWFPPRSQKVRGSILMSGTLYPPKMYADAGIGQAKTTSQQYDSPFKVNVARLLSQLMSQPGIDRPIKHATIRHIQASTIPRPVM